MTLRENTGCQQTIPAHQIASDMNKLTQERSRIHASIAKSALANQEIASNMNELTQEGSRIYASIVKSALAN